MQTDNPAPDCALGAGAAATSRSCWSVWQRSMLIAEASLCQSVSMLSALALHSITHSLIHSLIQLLTPSRTAAVRQFFSPTFLFFKIPTLPPFGQTSLSPGQTDVPLEKRPRWTISDTHPVSLIYKSSLEEKEFFFFPFLWKKCGWGLKVDVLLDGLTLLYLWLNHCHPELVTETQPFHKCCGFTVK